MMVKIIARIIEMLFITLMLILLAASLIAAFNPQMLFYLWSQI